MEGYIDIHSHILPGIDDGAKNFEMSMEMLQMAYDNKIRKIILTPHNKIGRHNAGPEKIRELAERIEAAAHSVGGIPPDYCACGALRKRVHESRTRSGFGSDGLLHTGECGKCDGTVWNGHQAIYKKSNEKGACPFCCNGLP